MIFCFLFSAFAGVYWHDTLLDRRRVLVLCSVGFIYVYIHMHWDTKACQSLYAKRAISCNCLFKASCYFMLINLLYPCLNRGRLSQFVPEQGKANLRGGRGLQLAGGLAGVTQFYTFYSVHKLLAQYC